MKREPSAYLWDMLQGCRAISSFVDGVGEDGYLSNLQLRSAVERQLQNVGEALSQLSKLDVTLAAQVPRQRQLIGLRNVLVHGYAGLNNAEVWQLVQMHLPDLQNAVEQLLNESKPDERR